ncbi:hypothetical protein ACEPAH_2460 [Sanghuangporus vaninii]
MARYNSTSSASLRTRLSALAEYLEAVAELRTMLLHSSPSFLISNPEELISLVEVAKATLQNNGISLHTFSSCPDYLSAYKSAYFGLLLQLQAHSHNARLESKDLQVRLNRLLFPLSTQLRVSTKVDKQDLPGGCASQTRSTRQPGTGYKGNSTDTNPAPFHPATSSFSSYLPKDSSSILPPNVMLPPPAPTRLSGRSSNIGEILTKHPSDGHVYHSRDGTSAQLDKVRPALSRRRAISNDTVHFKRRQGEAINLHGKFEISSPPSLTYKFPQGSQSHGSLNIAGDHYIRDRDQLDTAESSDSSSEDDDDSEPSHILVPSYSPLRRTFGIFCTGKGRGAFSGSMLGERRRTRAEHDRAPVSLRRRSKEVNMDIDS